MITRSTTVVGDRLSHRRVTHEAALQSRHGLKVTTLDGLVARLAGPFIQVADGVAVRRALSGISPAELETLAPIADLPGFARAAANTLRSAWSAGLDIASLATHEGGRWRDVAALEQRALERLPAGTLPNPKVVEMALQKVHLAPKIAGDIILDRLDEVPPVYRPLLTELSRHVKVSWHGRAGEPAGERPEGVEYEVPALAEPNLQTRVRCADPQHEVVEALRWARQLLASGKAAPGDIAIAAASVDEYEEPLLVLSREANLPVHFARGIPALSDRDGQATAALADVLQRGLDRNRVIRLVNLIRSRGSGAPELAELPDDWARALPKDAPLASRERWERALEAQDDRRDGVRELLRELGRDLTKGTDAAAEIGERWLRGRPRLLWRRALDEGPATAVDVSLTNLRVDDEVDPAAAIVVAPASVLAASPRPYVRLLGLASRSWPRRSAEDPLLPRHVLGELVLHETNLSQRDRRDFHAILASGTRALVFSRASRDAEGRRLAPSPLLAHSATGQETRLLPRRRPEHAFSEADRRLARPNELEQDEYSRAAQRAWRNWHTARLTPHDGMVRASHPAIARAVGRIHSATSLRLLLRNPLGFVWRYALGWKIPSDISEVLTLDALERGSLIHSVLEETVRDLEAGSGLAQASEGQIRSAAEEAARGVADKWVIESPVPPELLWRAAIDEAVTMTVSALSQPLEPLDGQRSFVEVPFGPTAHDGDIDTPWDPTAKVAIGENDLEVTGFIDRLDLSADGRQARVVDYKSSRKGRKLADRLVDIDDGKELQRCLYAHVVRQHLGNDVEVEAVLVFPATETVERMRDPDGTLSGLEQVVTLAAERLSRGYAVLGPDGEEDYFDMKLALPADLGRGYTSRKGKALGETRETIDAILLAEPPIQPKEPA
ncbi:MAG: PD-(D/E)XK nuclease family protein [Trueperaceae bacterium]